MHWTERLRQFKQEQDVSTINTTTRNEPFTFVLTDEMLTDSNSMFYRLSPTKQRRIARLFIENNRPPNMEITIHPWIDPKEPQKIEIVRMWGDFDWLREHVFQLAARD